MNENNENDHYLPSRELAYNYTVAMYFAQLLESNLRAILKIQDDHCYGMEIDAAFVSDAGRGCCATD